MMSRLQPIPLFVCLLFTSSVGVVSAQSTDGQPTTSLTRERVKFETSEYLRTHQFDEIANTWVLKPGFEPPVGVKSRDEVRDEREQFLRNNRYDDATSSWVSLKGEPRNLSKLSRERVRFETSEFLRSYRWDEVNNGWVKKIASKNK